MAEYSRLAKGSFTASASQTSAVIYLPFQPDYVEVWNMTNIGAGAPSSAAAITRAWWDNKVSVTPSGDLAANTMVEMYNGAGTGVVVFDTIANPNGISSFAAGQLLQYGPVYQYTNSGNPTFSITAAGPAVVTTTANHNLVSGDVVVFSNLYQTATTGMQQMAGIPLTVTVTNATTFSVNWNASGSNYTAFNSSTSTNHAGSWKQVLYPYLYAPEQAVITAVNTSTNVITTAAAHNFQVGQEVAFRIPTPWGSTQLNALPNILIPGSPNYYYVTAVTQNTFTVAQSLSGYTAFNPNQPFASFPGLKMPQVVPVGDVNSGGFPYTGGSLYPSPQLYTGYNNTITSTINGPAIQGAFVNNTAQGFVIGSGVTQQVGGTATIITASSVILWHAYLHDYANP